MGYYWDDKFCAIPQTGLPSVGAAEGLREVTAGYLRHVGGVAYHPCETVGKRKGERNVPRERGEPPKQWASDPSREQIRKDLFPSFYSEGNDG